MPGQIRNTLKVRIAQKEHADNARYTYRTINKLTGVATSTLSDWGTGNMRLISVDTLAALCDFLRCQPGDLLEYVPDPPAQEKPKKKTR